MPCVEQVRNFHRQDTDAESRSVKRRREEIPALSEERLSMTNRQRQKLQRWNPKGVVFTEGRNHSHEDHVADREFHSWHHLNLAHTTVPISKTMSILAAKKKCCRTAAVDVKRDCD